MCRSNNNVLICRTPVQHTVWLKQWKTHQLRVMVGRKIIKRGEVCLMRLNTSLLPALFSLLAVINQEHYRVESHSYLRVHQQSSVAQEDWWEAAKKKKKKDMGAGMGLLLWKEMTELKGHCGVHHALICSTGNRVGTCTTVSQYVGDGEAEGWGTVDGKEMEGKRNRCKNWGRQSKGGERQETDSRGGWLSVFYGQI